MAIKIVHNNNEYYVDPETDTPLYRSYRNPPRINPSIGHTQGYDVFVHKKFYYVVEWNTEDEDKYYVLPHDDLEKLLQKLIDTNYLGFYAKRTLTLNKFHLTFPA